MQNEGIEIQPPNQNNICIYSSGVFLINSVIALYYNYAIYSLLFAILWVTSVIHRLHRNIFTNIINKIAIFAVVVYGGNLFYEKLERINGTRDILISVLIINTFLATIFLFYAGYILKKYCYCDDPILREKYHALLHFISCVGHLLIVVL